MIRWKCGNCGTLYSIEEFLALKSRCVCGYVFGRDKWHLIDNVQTIKDGVNMRFTISTVFLEIEHDEYLTMSNWYETMIFTHDTNIPNEPLWRYPTKAEAEEGHKKVVKALCDGKFTLTKKGKEYSLNVYISDDPND